MNACIYTRTDCSMTAPSSLPLEEQCKSAAEYDAFKSSYVISFFSLYFISRGSKYTCSARDNSGEQEGVEEEEAVVVMVIDLLSLSLSLRQK